VNEITYWGRHWLVAKVGVGQVIVLSLYIDVFLCRVSIKIQLCKSIVIAADCDDDAGYAARGELKAAERHVGTRNQDFVDAIEKYTSRCGRSDSDIVFERILMVLLRYSPLAKIISSPATALSTFV
jgi:hypothetical protein